MSDDEEEYDYGDEESDYDVPDSPRFEVGFKEQQFQGRFVDEMVEEERFGSVIEGGGALGRIQHKRNFVDMDPMEKFIIHLNEEISNRGQDLKLGPNDIRKLKEVARDLQLVQYKNALLYLLGYYVTKVIKSRQLDAKVKKMAGKHLEIEVVKYARFWKNN